jgi:hypothetical protein
MPWKVCADMDERKRFVEDWERGVWSFVELCDRYGVSRPTGYPRKPRKLFSQPAGHLHRIHLGLPWLVCTSMMPVASWHGEAISLTARPCSGRTNDLRRITPQNRGKSWEAGRNLPCSRLAI